MWLREQNQTYYCQIDGKQHNLGQDKKEAEDEYHRLMSDKASGVPLGTRTVREVLDACWKWLQGNRSTETCKRRESVLKSFGPVDPCVQSPMLIIINDDRAYVSWLSRHRRGYVVDSKRKPTKGHLILHRATCSLIKPHKRARLTTGAHIKACSLDAAELAAWATEQTGGQLSPCPQCQPDREESPGTDEHAHHALTRLGKEIVSYVLDLAVMYLDGEAGHYGPSVEAIAVYLDKMPKQLMPALCRAIEEDYLECDPPVNGGIPPDGAIIYPTARALRTIPAFDALLPKVLAAEIECLKRHL